MSMNVAEIAQKQIVALYHKEALQSVQVYTPLSSYVVFEDPLMLANGFSCVVSQFVALALIFPDVETVETSLPVILEQSSLHVHFVFQVRHRYRVYGLPSWTAVTLPSHVHVFLTLKASDSDQYEITRLEDWWFGKSLSVTRHWPVWMAWWLMFMKMVAAWWVWLLTPWPEQLHRDVRQLLAERVG